MQEKKFRIDVHNQTDSVNSSSITTHQSHSQTHNDAKQQSSSSSEQQQHEDDDDEHLIMVIPPHNHNNTQTRTRRTRARSNPDLRRVSPKIPLPTPTQVERVLPNGDLYTGTVLGNAPHGAGKYLWSDGCMYEGEWYRGKATGKGRFSWPSGATYEGGFKGGRMDGYGTFTGIDGDTYRGPWLCDKKHGRGEKWYANGDYYQGLWRDNVQDGVEGRYVWSNGSVYVGEWRNGMISGKGVLIWVNGNRYEGYWENGVPKGEGVFTRGADGSTYMGDWGNENENEMMVAELETDDDGDKKRGLIDTTVTERAVNFPRICIWEEDDEEGGDITCDIIDNVEVSKLCRPNSFNNSLIDHKNRLDNNKSPRNGSQSPSPRPYWFGGGSDDVRKPGQAISKGHKNYDLMLTLQLGIRYSVGKYASKWRELKQSDFEPKEKYWTKFPAEGSKTTPRHQSVDFRWKDYFPMVFRQLRELFGIDPAEYMLAICESDSLREFSSPGKSGSSFYLTQDDRFMIKTVKKSEVKVLIRMLPSYYRHVFKYKNTLITKFFGLHCIKPIGGPKTRFVVMGNLFHSDYRIHKRFDLKGSSYGRSIDKPEGEIDETTTLKDLDLNFMFRLQHSWFQDLIRQVDRDCEFLEAERIMDYSLLIGLHFRDDFPGDIDMSPPGRVDSKSPRGNQVVDPKPPDTEWMIEGSRPFIRLGANMPARAERVIRIEIEQQGGGGGSVRSSGGGSGTPRNGETTSTSPQQNSGTPRIRIIGDGTGEVFNVILYFGIIDILQDYDISKRIEHAYKSLQVDPTSISAVDPKFYSKRFRDFIHKIFVEDKEE